VQIDVKFVQPIPGLTPRRKHYQFTAIDDCTRLRVLRIYPACNQKTAIQFLDYVLARLPFPVQIIQTDNGTEFQSAFHYHALDKRRPRLYPTPHPPAGRQSRTLPPHRRRRVLPLLDGTLIDDAKIFNDKLREWEDYYNYHRPHGALDGQTPYERLRAKTRAPV
jgi:transposase InsO family protein